MRDLLSYKYVAYIFALYDLYRANTAQKTHLTSESRSRVEYFNTK